MKLNAHFGNYERPTDTPGHREVSLPINIRLFLSNLFPFPHIFSYDLSFNSFSFSICLFRVFHFYRLAKYGVLIAAVFSYFLVCF